MIIGIDPGITGAIALLKDNGNFIEVVDMPIMAMGKKNQVNACELANILQKYKEMAIMDEKTLIVAVEMVHAMPGQGVAAMFNFGMGFGVIKGVVAALRLPIDFVTPQAWKKKFSLLGKDKDNARTLAQEYYPEASLARKKDGGRADALLIAKYMA